MGVCMDEQMDEWMGGWRDSQLSALMDERMNGWTGQWWMDR